MQDFALPENYPGSNLLTIKKTAENIRLENHKTKQNSHTSYTKPVLWSKEASNIKPHLHEDNRRRKMAPNKNLKSKKLDYQKLFSTKHYKTKRESLLIDIELSKHVETKLLPTEATDANVSSVLVKSQNIMSGKKILFGIIKGKKTEAAIKTKAIKLFIWAIKMIRAWLRYLNYVIQKTHRQQQKYLYVAESFNNESRLVETENNDLNFNKNNFKASKEIELTLEMKKILSLHPKQRTSEQISTVMYGLSALSAFNEYPVHLKRKLCTVAHFRKVDARRVIIRQGHVAEYFYFIISGTAIVTITSNDDSGQERKVNSLAKGCSFGELALLHHSRRTASIVSTSAMQLLAIERNDFFYVFMHMSTEYSKYPEHIAFLRDIPIFNHLNFDHLLEQPEACLCHFYKNDILISANDIESEWVYIVKSGSCRLIKELKIPIESKFIRENTMSLNDVQSRIRCYDEYHFIPMQLNECTGNSKSKTRPLWRTPTILKPGDYFYLKNESHDESQHQKQGEHMNSVSVFIKVTDLVPKDIYGLSSVIFSSEDQIRTENMASVTLISKKAEMVLISKKFLAMYSNEDLIKDIRQGLTQYPPEQVFLENYKTRIEWEQYKIQRYNALVNKSN